MGAAACQGRRRDCFICLRMPPSHDLQSMCARPVCSMHIGCIPARMLQLAWIIDPVLCMCVPFVCYSVARGCYMLGHNIILMTVVCMQLLHTSPDLQKGTISRIWNAYIAKKHIAAMLCTIWIKCGCFIEEALLQQWCGNKVLGLHHQGVTGLSSQHFRLQWGFWKMVDSRTATILRFAVLIVPDILMYCNTST